MSAQEIRGSQTLKYVVLGLVLLQTVAMAVFAYARLGNFRHMSDPLQRLAIKVRNPSVPREVPAEWTMLCRAWATWLPVLQREAPRWLRTEDLWEPNDPLRAQLAEFLAMATELRPETLVPAAATEKNLQVLAESPSDWVLNELGMTHVADRVRRSGLRILQLREKLESWPRWNELRTLLRLMQDHGFTQVAVALQSRLPPEPGSHGFKVNTVRTLRLLNELSRDESGALLLIDRWSGISQLEADMTSSGDRIQKAMPALILSRLTDQPTLAAFADSMSGPLEEMRLRRKQFMDTKVDRIRFLQESPLQKENGPVIAADFLRWELELVRFSSPTAPAVQR